MIVWVFAPHPDDDIIGCGGSIVHHVRRHDNVSIVYMTSGDAGNLLISKQKLALVREKEARLGASTLGVTDCMFLRLPDGHVERTSASFIRLVELIREGKPDMVYIPHKYDGHKDHVATFAMVNEALQAAGRESHQECKGKPWNAGTILCYEVWTPLAAYTYVENITDSMDTKLAAMRQHASQLANVTYDEAVAGLNRYRGATTGKGKYAECFEILRLASLPS